MNDLLKDIETLRREGFEFFIHRMGYYCVPPENKGAAIAAMTLTLCVGGAMKHREKTRPDVSIKRLDPCVALSSSDEIRGMYLGHRNGMHEILTDDNQVQAFMFVKPSAQTDKN